MRGIAGRFFERLLKKNQIKNLKFIEKKIRRNPSVTIPGAFLLLKKFTVEFVNQSMQELLKNHCQM